MATYSTVETIRACVESDSFKQAVEEIVDKYAAHAVAQTRAAVREGNIVRAAFHEGRATAIEQFFVLLTNYVEGAQQK